MEFEGRVYVNRRPENHNDTLVRMGKRALFWIVGAAFAVLLISTAYLASSNLAAQNSYQTLQESSQVCQAHNADLNKNLQYLSRKYMDLAPDIRSVKYWIEENKDFMSLVKADVEKHSKRPVPNIPQFEDMFKMVNLFDRSSASWSNMEIEEDLHCGTVIKP